MLTLKLQGGVSPLYNLFTRQKKSLKVCFPNPDLDQNTLKVTRIGFTVDLLLYKLFNIVSAQTKKLHKNTTRLDGVVLLVTDPYPVYSTTDTRFF